MDLKLISAGVWFVLLADFLVCSLDAFCLFLLLRVYLHVQTVCWLISVCFRFARLFDFAGNLLMMSAWSWLGLGVNFYFFDRFLQVVALIRRQKFWWFFG